MSVELEEDNELHAIEGNYSIDIYDFIGIPVKQIKGIKEKKVSLDISKLKPGLYQVLITHSKGVIKEHLLIE